MNLVKNSQMLWFCPDNTVSADLSRIPHSTGGPQVEEETQSRRHHYDILELSLRPADTIAASDLLNVKPI